LLRRYHNSIKQKILAKCIHNSSDPTLIDIGSGNRADIGKWVGFKTITAIEASPSKIQVIKNRLKNNYSYLIKHVKLLNIDFLNYSGTSSDYITCFFMLNNIQDKKILNKFIKLLCSKVTKKCYMIF